MKITRSRTGFLFSSVTLWLAWAVAAIPATAQTPEFGTLLNFTGGPDGMTPVGALVEYGGEFFRTAARGGGPPMKVPAATAPRHTNRWICADRTARGTGSSGRKCSSWSGSPDRNTSRRPVPSAPPAPRQFSAGIVAGGGRAGPPPLSP